jgi:ABC-type cobalamin/Fe3+-siderophores transport system ATPase subunit
MLGRAVATLAVIVGFLIYVYAANVYVAQTYFGKGKSAGPAVPITQQIQQIAQTITQYMQIATMIVIAAIAVNIAIKSRRILGIIPFKDVQRHLLLLGPTGSGKTTIAKKVIDMAVKRGIKVTILDWKAGSRAFHCGRPRPVKQQVGHLYFFFPLKGVERNIEACRPNISPLMGVEGPFRPAQRGEYISHVKGATIIRKINVWDVGGRNPAEKAVVAIELLREVTRDIADVSSASATLLLKELAKLYSEKGTPTTKDVVEKVERFMQSALTERRQAEANMAAAILRRLTGCR